MAQLLLDHGVDPNIQCDDFCDPLHLASADGHLKIAEFLVQRGASVKMHGRGRVVAHASTYWLPPMPACSFEISHKIVGPSATLTLREHPAHVLRSGSRPGPFGGLLGSRLTPPCSHWPRRAAPGKGFPKLALMMSALGKLYLLDNTHTTCSSTRERQTDKTGIPRPRKRISHKFTIVMNLRGCTHSSTGCQGQSALL